MAAPNWPSPENSLYAAAEQAQDHLTSLDDKIDAAQKLIDSYRAKQEEWTAIRDTYLIAADRLARAEQALCSPVGSNDDE